MERRARITILMLPAHRAAIERIAEADGEPMSVVLRRLIRREAKVRGLWPKAEGQLEEAQADDIVRERVRV